MDFIQWWESLNGKQKGVDKKEGQRRVEVKKRGAEKAKTTVLSLSGCYQNRSIGMNLGQRLEFATKDESEQFSMMDEMKRKLS